MTGIDALAGTLGLRPGAALPNIRSSRRHWAADMARGRPAAALPDLLAAVYSLCGDAHRLAARNAVAAASGQPPGDVRADDRALQVDTLREQLRRIWLDWPLALGTAAATERELVVLRDCPLQQRGAAGPQGLAAMPAWLASHLLGQAPADWLAAWEAEGGDWLDRWSRSADTLAARQLRGCRDRATTLGDVPQPLRVQADPAELAMLVARMRADRHFVLAPSWRGETRETGPWTRLNDPHWARHANAWLRLGARLAECVRLGLPDEPGRSGADWLRHGAMTLAPGEGLAWCEMARGLLLHRVRLDAAVPDGGTQAQRIAECDVLAPTEWNFHPRGAVARALAALPADVDDGTVRLLAAAFDPCVAVRVLHEGHAEGADA